MPQPICPKCHSLCETVFGMRPEPQVRALPGMPREQFLLLRSDEVELSVRTKMLCREHRCLTIGQLAELKAAIVGAPRATEGTRFEIDQLLERTPHE